MARNILILGASYGSLLATKLLMAGHNVTLVCRRKTADLINRDGTEVRIKLRDEAVHRAIFSRDLPGKLDATTPAEVDLSRYDLVGLAMQEPQYTNHTIRVLMIKIATAGLMPDRTLLIDLESEVAMARIGSDRVRNRLDDEPIEFHRRVRDGFLAEAQLDPARFVVLDGSRTPEEIVQDAVTAISEA